MGVMKNLSTDPITDGAGLTPVEQTFFDDLVKESAETGTNEDQTVEGVNPAGDEKEEALEEPKAPDGPVFSNEARRRFIEGREKLLKELLPGASRSSDPAEQKLVKQQFGVPYETSSPQLSKGASIETLEQTVRRVTGRS